MTSPLLWALAVPTSLFAAPTAIYYGICYVIAPADGLAVIARTWRAVGQGRSVVDVAAELYAGLVLLGLAGFGIIYVSNPPT